LIGILLEDELYASDDEAIIDEILTFYLAGMDTTGKTNANQIVHTCLDPKVYQKCMAEIDQYIIKPYKAAAAKGGAQQSITQSITYDMTQDLRYTQTCMNETVRMNPPVSISVDNITTEDV
jgi:cytochrome P450